MENMVGIRDYPKAYVEVLEIINSLSAEEYSKIPEEEIEFFERNKDENYAFSFDETKSLNEQDFSSEAKAIIVLLFQKYFATEEENERINNLLDENEKRHQEELREKYNPDNLFKKEEIVKEEVKEEKLPAEIKKESFIQRVINIIKNLFSK